MPTSEPVTRLERAIALDAAGNFDEAINELARGTRERDAACTRALGLRLLTGDRAPFLPQDGLRFLGEACERGLPEAAARAAGILALGVRVPPNWAFALEWLYRSAAMGWAPAQRQLLGLCDDRPLAKRAALEPRIDWRAIAGAVDLNSWRRAPAVEIKSDDPRIGAIPDFLRPELCDVLIEAAQGSLERARVYDAAIGENVVKSDRDNSVANFNVDSVEMLHALLQARMSAACGIPERMMEAPTVLHYAPGQRFHDHYDFVDPGSTTDYAAELARNGQRIVTFLVYLNDDYEGGETAFPNLNLAHRGRRGEGLYFSNALADLSPDMRMLHAGRPPTRGEKWIVSQFIRSRATR